MKTYENDNQLLNIGGCFYYFDLGEFFNSIKIDNKEGKKEKTVRKLHNEDDIMISKEEETFYPAKEREIDASRYETISSMITVILNTSEDIDDELGQISLNKLPLNFKFAFNTLLFYGIIKEL